jgi:hypothetical protein
MVVCSSPVPRPHDIEPSGLTVGDGREQQRLALVFIVVDLDGNCSTRSRRRAKHK